MGARQLKHPVKMTKLLGLPIASFRIGSQTFRRFVASLFFRYVGLLYCWSGKKWLFFDAVKVSDLSCHLKHLVYEFSQTFLSKLAEDSLSSWPHWTSDTCVQYRCTAYVKCFYTFTVGSTRVRGDDWIDLAQDMNKYLAFVYAVMNSWVP